MSTRTFITTLLIAGALVASPAFAQDNATTSDQPTREQKREEMRERTERPNPLRAIDARPTVRERMENATSERGENMRERFGAERTSRIENLITMMTNRFEHAIERLDQIASRIESRIEKIEEEEEEESDTATDEASEHLRNARAHLDAAHDALARTIAAAEDLLTDGDSTNESFLALRTGASSVHVEVRSAWEDLRLSVEALKATRPERETPEAEEADETETNDEE